MTVNKMLVEILKKMIMVKKVLMRCSLWWCGRGGGGGEGGGGSGEIDMVIEIIEWCCKWIIVGKIFYEIL